MHCWTIFSITSSTTWQRASMVNIFILKVIGKNVIKFLVCFMPIRGKVSANCSYLSTSFFWVFRDFFIFIFTFWHTDWLFWSTYIRHTQFLKCVLLFSLLNLPLKSKISIHHSAFYSRYYESFPWKWIDHYWIRIVRGKINFIQTKWLGDILLNSCPQLRIRFSSNWRLSFSVPLHNCGQVPPNCSTRVFVLVV